jgi:predicted P-loop ATPase
MNGDVVEVEAEEIPLGDVLVELEAERNKKERKAKRAVVAALSARGLQPGRRLGGDIEASHVDDVEASDSMAWRGLLLFDKNGKPRSSPGNVLKVLEGDEGFRGSLVKDTFRAKWMWTRRPVGADIDGPFPREMTDGDVSYIGSWMESAHEVVPSLNVLGAQLGAYASRHTVDVLRDYLLALKWDGKQRLDSWLTACLGVVDNAYTRAVGRRWLISAVARGLSPGCKADCVLILEGAQGKKKSTALQVLGGPWHTDSLPLHIDDKDAVIVLGGKWIVEWGEFDRFGRNDQSTIKDFVQKKTDTIRPPYGRIAEDWPRRCAFAATTNEDGYLLDGTGGRRWWPVRVGDVAIDRLRKYRDQLWAEAVVAYAAWAAAHGDERHPDYVRNQWWLTKEEEALQVLEAEQRYTADPWEERLRDYVHGRDSVGSIEALKELGIDPGKAAQHDQRRLAKALRRLGMHRVQVRVASGREWRYVPVTTIQNAGDTGGDTNLSKIGAVTTVTTVTTTSAHTGARAPTHAQPPVRAGDVVTQTYTPENTGNHVTTSVTTKSGVVVTNPGDLQLTLDDIWGLG